jgi:hypothetical protein
MEKPTINGSFTRKIIYKWWFVNLSDGKKFDFLQTCLHRSAKVCHQQFLWISDPWEQDPASEPYPRRPIWAPLSENIGSFSINIINWRCPSQLKLLEGIWARFAVNMRQTIPMIGIMWHCLSEQCQKPRGCIQNNVWFYGDAHRALWLSPKKICDR